MKFYPDLNLYTYYFRAQTQSDWFSSRIQDKTTRVTLDGINRAINICEKSEMFLDFGAGGGRYSAALLPFFGGGIGIEIEPNPHLKELAAHNKQFQSIFGNDVIKKVKKKIDFIQLIDVIEHIPTSEVDRLVKSFSSLQGKGGVIHVLTPNAIRCGVVERSGIYYKRFTHGHHKHYLAEELNLIFSRYGYIPIIKTYEDFTFRQLVRQLMLGCSLIDRKLQSIPLYSFLSYPVVFVLNVLFSTINYFVVWAENNNTDDCYHARTLVMTFKKLL